VWIRPNLQETVTLASAFITAGLGLGLYRFLSLWCARRVP